MIGSMLPSKNRVTITVGISFLLSASALASPGSKSNPVPGVARRAAKELFAANPGQVGLSVGVWRNGKASAFNYGKVEKGGRHKPTSRTLYRIASVGKTFTSTLLAQAAVEHKVRLEDDIRKYLDGSYPNLEYRGTPIELQYLTNHRSGLPFIFPDKPEAMPDDPGNPTPWIQRITELWKGYTRLDFYRDLSQVKLSATPNTRSSYSNVGAQLLGYVLERVYGESYENLVRKKITGPLHMRDTTISLSASQIERLAKGYDEKGQPALPFPDAIAGAGALKSTEADLMEYVRWQLSERSPAVKLSHRPVFTVGDYSAGLNWQMMKKGDRRLIWQSGSFPGFQTLLVMEPELHLGLVLLSNVQDRASSGSDLQNMANQILKSLDARAIMLP